MSNRDDRYYTTHRARTPAADQSTVFFQGQGGRPLLPPISSAFPTSSSPVPSHSNPYSQRSSPNRFDYNQPSYNNQWQPNNTPMAPQPGFGYYEDARYSAQAYPVYAPRPSTVAPGQHSDHRKLPPLSTTPGPSGRDDRWASPYPTPPSYNGSPPNSHIRSPTASYPASYATAYPAPHAHGYPVNDPRYVSSMGPQLMANDPRAVSPFGRGHPHPSPPTPPPISPIGGDEPTVKKKRKRADANQLRVLNETYARTAFPSTEERLALAKALDMSPRSVQIWFQNKRQSMRQTNRQSSNAQSFSLSPDDQMDDLEYEGISGAPRGGPPPPPMPPSSSHRRSRPEDVNDARKWSRGY